MSLFNSFYRTNKNRLFGYFLRRTGDYHLSADMMQESFTRYYERYSEQKEYSLPLLFTIGRNLLYDSSRRGSGHDSFDEKTHGRNESREADILIREESRQVLKALEKIGKEEADILSLVVSSGLSYAEIGKITGNSETNIKVKVHRARKKLRDILGKGDSE